MFHFDHMWHLCSHIAQSLSNIPESKHSTSLFQLKIWFDWIYKFILIGSTLKSVKHFTLDECLRNWEKCFTLILDVVFNIINELSKIQKVNKYIFNLFNRKKCSVNIVFRTLLSLNSFTVITLIINNICFWE